MRPIRLILFDIDGVLTKGEARGLDLDLLGGLARMNRAARANPTQPAATLCTGRPAPYVEALAQAINGHLPCVFENGCGLYEPDGYRFLPHPLLGDGHAFDLVRERLCKHLVQTRKAFVQPGKEYSLSLFPLDSVHLSELHGLTEAALGPLTGAVSLVYSSSCLNVIPQGIDKGAGLDFLCDRGGYSREEILGVGDSDVDLPFLALAGRSAAPANAFDQVKAAVNYVSPHEATAGVRDILRHFGVALPAE